MKAYPGLVLVVLSACLPVFGGCAASTPMVFEVVDASGSPVAGAHARIIVLDAGAALPLNTGSLEEVAHLRSATGGFTDGRGRIVLPVMRSREHLIEVEGPALGVGRAGEAEASFWIYQRDGGLAVRSGQAESGLRVRRVE